MKKFFALLFFLACVFAPLKADDSQQERMKDLIKRRLVLIAGAPLNAHWINVQSKIVELLEEISQQLNTKSIVITFDQRAFDFLVMDVLIKLSMPSVGDSEREELLESVAMYLYEKGQLARVYNVLQMDIENQDSENACDAIQHIQGKLEEIKAKAESLQKEK